MVAMNPEQWERFVTAAFRTLGLPEVQEHELETGTYTNRQIADKIGDPLRLVHFLMTFDHMRGQDEGSLRSMLSFAVDMLDSEQ